MKKLISITALILMLGSCGSIFKPVDLNKAANTAALTAGGFVAVDFLNQTVTSMLNASPSQEKNAEVALKAFNFVIEAEKVRILKDTHTSSKTINTAGLQSLYKIYLDDRSNQRINNFLAGFQVNIFLLSFFIAVLAGLKIFVNRKKKLRPIKVKHT